MSLEKQKMKLLFNVVKNTLNYHLYVQLQHNPGAGKGRNSMKHEKHIQQDI